MLSLPPLSLYVHLPWCVQKCPYCDFNSHALKTPLPALDYVQALVADLESDLPRVWGRPVSSVFFGGGTPSLFDAEQIGEILKQVRARLPLHPQLEVTLEANPGTIEYDDFGAYREAGVSRVSLGVQSFDEVLLRRLGRIHGVAEIYAAVESLRAAEMNNFNLDLMFALPGQTLEQAAADLNAAIELRPSHISYYQLTLEPNTAFAAKPPPLPDDDLAWAMQKQGQKLLRHAGYHQYEVSAYAQSGRQCQHNLNYWRFGDYLGIGAGAHGKITDSAQSRIVRTAKQRHPKTYLQALQNGAWLAEERVLTTPEAAFEFFLNHFRLAEPVPQQRFERRTGLAWAELGDSFRQAELKELLKQGSDQVEVTALGFRYLNDLQALFLPD